MAKFETNDLNVETDGLIAGPIKSYLESSHKEVHKEVLDETVQRMRQVIVRDLMTPRDSRAGKEHNTLYTGACARKARLTYDGAAKEPIKARTILKFLLGDLVELSVLAVARLAGCHIQHNNADLSIRGEDGVEVAVHPDGLYQSPDTDEWYNVEIKSCDSRTFDAWLENGGPDDAWGYLTQASVECQAWREAGYKVKGTLFIAVSTGSRQGSVGEWFVPVDENLVANWHARRYEARQAEVPKIPFAPEPEMEFMRGKEVQPEWFEHGEPSPRKNDKGAIYGWDCPTGRQIVPLTCSYCDYKQHCWPKAVLEIDRTKPVWVVPAC